MISVLTLCSGIDIANGSTWLSTPIPLANLGQHCNLYLDLTVGAGTGTLTGTLKISDGTAYATFLSPSGSDGTLCTGHGKTTNTVGRDMYKFNSYPYMNQYLVIGLAAATADASNVTGKLIIWTEGTH